MGVEDDKVGKLILESVEGPLGFASNDQEVEPSKIIQVEIVEGRETKIETKEGQKGIKPKIRVIIGPTGLTFLPDSNISVDDLALLLSAGQNEQAKIL